MVSSKAMRARTAASNAAGAQREARPMAHEQQMDEIGRLLKEGLEPDAPGHEANLALVRAVLRQLVQQSLGEDSLDPPGAMEPASWSPALSHLH